MHTCCCIKWLAAPGHLPIGYHRLLLSCPAPFCPLAQSGDPRLDFECDCGMWTPERLRQAVSKMVLILYALSPQRGHEDTEPARARPSSESLHSPTQIDVNVRREPQWRWFHLQPLWSNEHIRSSRWVWMIPQSLLLLLRCCHSLSKVHVKACGVTKILTGHSSYSWLSKGEVTALFASNLFPLALHITITTVSISEMSVWSQSWRGWHLATLYHLGYMVFPSFAEKLLYADY